MEEKKVINFHDRNKIFEKQNMILKNRRKYVFYDGPPFATGLPHYGNLLAGTIKDIICRFQAQVNNMWVPRRWGWDTHGLPVEYMIDKENKIKSRNDVIKMGIDKYNEKCRNVVLRYTNEWKDIIKRFGRWIDMDEPYKTMDTNYMESVWYVFKQIFDKGLVYRSYKV